MLNRTELKAWMREHLFYKWQMLRHALARALTLQAPEQQLDFNAYLESCAIHARVLYEFLTNDSGKGNNSVVAENFVPNFRAEKTNATKGIMPRLNSQIAHAGKQRTVDRSKKLSLDQCIELNDWIAPAMERFISQLDDEYRAAWPATPPSAFVTIVLGDSQTTTSAASTATIVELTPMRDSGR
jgi:hypothetical protein